jgi:hypothetical protein
MNDAMKVQVGGTHYKGMAIEPFEFGHANDYDAECFSVMKYVSRHRSKGGAEDLKKALHIVDIRLSQIEKWGEPMLACDTIPVETFVTENSIGMREASILRKLHAWALNPDAYPPAHAEPIKAELAFLIETYERCYL